MVAMGGAGGNEPVAVSVGTKRDDEVLVLRVGVRSDFQRLGHGGHLLTSLSQKLAVLGPERLIAEVPERPELDVFFVSLGWRREIELTDWTLSPEAAAAGAAAPAELTAEVTVADLDRAGLLPETPDAAWARRRQTLMQSAERLVGTALLSSERLEAFALCEPEPVGRVLVAGAADPERTVSVLGPLLRSLAGRAERPLELPRMTGAEAAALGLGAIGCAPGARYHRWATAATPL